jgi:hypothetical protein
MDNKLKEYFKKYFIADIGLFLLFIGCAYLLTQILKFWIL